MSSTQGLSLESLGNALKDVDELRDLEASLGRVVVEREALG